MSAAADSAQPVVLVQDVHTYYGKSHILHGVSLNVGAGEVVGLLGRNGVGKSTTLKTIMGLVRPSQGVVQLSGSAVTGLPPDKVEALIAGLPTSFDDPRQQVIYDLTQALIGPRVVPTGLYRRAMDLLGDAGVTDLTMLLGYYTTVSLTLAAYNVPADAVGLKR